MKPVEIKMCVVLGEIVLSCFLTSSMSVPSIAWRLAVQPLISVSLTKNNFVPLGDTVLINC